MIHATLFLIVVLCLLFVISMLYAKTLLWIMHTDLEEWISYGTGDDIYRCKEQRPEFQYYVERLLRYPTEPKLIPRKTVVWMRDDFKKGLVRPVYFWILWVKLKKFVSK